MPISLFLLLTSDDAIVTLILIVPLDYPDTQDNYFQSLQYTQFQSNRSSILLFDTDFADHGHIFALLFPMPHHFRSRSDLQEQRTSGEQGNVNIRIA